MLRRRIKVEMLRSLPIRAYLATVALRDRQEGQALVEYALLVSLNPDDARSERVGDLLEDQHRALVGGITMTSEGASTSEPDIRLREWSPLVSSAGTGAGRCTTHATAGSAR